MYIYIYILKGITSFHSPILEGVVEKGFTIARSEPKKRIDKSIIIAIFENDLLRDV